LAEVAAEADRLFNFRGCYCFSRRIESTKRRIHVTPHFQQKKADKNARLHQHFFYLLNESEVFVCLLVVVKFELFRLKKIVPITVSITNYRHCDLAAGTFAY